MRKIAAAMLAVCCLVFAVTYGNAESFKILGTRPLSMGGAYVAIAEDAITQYWNPAGLGIGKDFDIQLPVGLQAEMTGDILGSANRLKDIAGQFTNISQAQSSGRPLTLDQLAAFANGIKELDDLNAPDKGVIVDIDAGGNIRVGHFALSMNNFTSMGIDPTVDTHNLGLGHVPAPHKRIICRAGSVGVDLGQLISNSSIGGSALANKPTDPTCAAAATTLSTSLQQLASAVGITIGNYSYQQVANAVVNAATDPAIITKLNTQYGLNLQPLSNTQVQNYVTQISQNTPLIVALLQGLSNTSYAQNQSSLKIRGVSTFEASLGYGMAVPYVQDENVLGGALEGLYAGANLKYIKGYVGYVGITVLNGAAGDASDIYSDFSDKQKTSNALGLDLGLLLQKKVLNKKINVGLLARNLNSPTFDQPDAAILAGEDSKYKVDPQLRAGVAIWPFNWWTISSDLDLTKNKTPLPGYYSRQWGLGNEFNLVNSPAFNIALRAGIMKNLAESSSKIAYTGGLGLNLLHLVIDIGGAFSSDTVEITSNNKSYDIPVSAAAALTISLDF